MRLFTNMKVLSSDEGEKPRVFMHKNDEKILSLLCNNIRLPLSKIAKILNLSRQSVEYRINVMNKNHLLAGSRTLVNIKKLGYQSYHFFLNVASDNAERIFRQNCIEDSSVNALISYSGKWNYEVSIMESSPEKAQNKFLNLIKNLDIENYFSCILLENIKSSVLPGIVSKTRVIKNIKNDPSFSRQFLEKKIEYTPDSKDLEILYLLSQDAQINISAIGRRVKLTKDTISYRIKKLIKSNYIVQFRPIIDFSVLGLSVQALLVKMDSKNPRDNENIKNYLEKSDKVLWATRLFGDWDYLVYILDKNVEEIHSFIKDLKKEFKESIKSYEILYAYHEYKYGFMTENIAE